MATDGDGYRLPRLRGGLQYSPQPRDVPGYDEARLAETLPAPVPEEAPKLLPGLPAARYVWGYGIAAASGLLGITLIVVFAATHAPGWLSWVVVATMATVLIGAITWVTVGLPRRRNLEATSGYCTLDDQPFDGLPSRTAALWFLDSKSGAVRRTPDRSLDPPGYYPSPQRPGTYQLWSGRLWVNQSFVADPGAARARNRPQ